MSDSEEAPPEPRPARPITYAHVTRGGTPSTVSQMSGWTDRRQEEFTKLQEQHSELQDKFHRVSEEIGELKELLQQLRAQNQDLPNKKQAIFTTPTRTERRSRRGDNEMEAESGSSEIDPNAGNSQHMQE